MAKRRVCKICRRFTDGSECPSCKTSQFATTWKGRICVLEPEKSLIAQRVGLKEAGEYAIKVR